TVALAQKVDGLSDGAFAGVRFDADRLKAIEYAGLVHDFGKVGVRENVLVKAKKLYDHDRRILLGRFDYIRKEREGQHLRRMLETARSDWPALEAAYAVELKELDAAVEVILRANEPTVLPEGSF